MKNDTINMLAGIPTLDIRSFESGSESDRKQFVEQLGHAYETIGFVAIHGHGISDALIDSLYAESRAFFELPQAIKRQHARP